MCTPHRARVWHVAFCVLATTTAEPGDGDQIGVHIDTSWIGDAGVLFLGSFGFGSLALADAARCAGSLLLRTFEGA